MPAGQLHYTKIKSRGVKVYVAQGVNKGLPFVLLFRKIDGGGGKGVVRVGPLTGEENAREHFIAFKGAPSIGEGLRALDKEMRKMTTLMAMQPPERIPGLTEAQARAWCLAVVDDVMSTIHDD